MALDGSRWWLDCKSAAQRRSGDCTCGRLLVCQPNRSHRGYVAPPRGFVFLGAHPPAPALAARRANTSGHCGRLGGPVGRGGPPTRPPRPRPRGRPRVWEFCRTLSPTGGCQDRLATSGQQRGRAAGPRPPRRPIVCLGGPFAPRSRRPQPLDDVSMGKAASGPPHGCQAPPPPPLPRHPPHLGAVREGVPAGPPIVCGGGPGGAPPAHLSGAHPHLAAGCGCKAAAANRGRRTRAAPRGRRAGPTLTPLAACVRTARRSPPGGGAQPHRLEPSGGCQS